MRLNAVRDVGRLAELRLLGTYFSSARPQCVRYRGRGGADEGCCLGCWGWWDDAARSASTPQTLSKLLSDASSTPFPQP